LEAAGAMLTGATAAGAGAGALNAGGSMDGAAGAGALNAGGAIVGAVSGTVSADAGAVIGAAAGVGAGAVPAWGCWVRSGEAGTAGATTGAGEDGGVETAKGFIPAGDSAATTAVPVRSKNASMPGRVLFIAFIKY